MSTTQDLLLRASTGVTGLGDVRQGGLARNPLHLLESGRGMGKSSISVWIGDRSPMGAVG